MSIPTISDLAGITAQPELRFTNSGKAVLSIRLAFNDSKHNDQTQKWETTKTFYVDAQAWEQTAERLAEQLNQGDQVYVTGRLETQSWEDKDGGKRSKPILNVQTVRKLARADVQDRARTQPAGYGGNGTSQAAQGDQWGGTGSNAPNDPWATPVAANATGWGSAPTDTEPPF